MIVPESSGRWDRDLEIHNYNIITKLEGVRLDIDLRVYHRGSGFVVCVLQVLHTVVHAERAPPLSFSRVSCAAYRQSSCL